jgi:hypothetical protein
MEDEVISAGAFAASESPLDAADVPNIRRLLRVKVSGKIGAEWKVSY